jgi:5-methylcytosine-specific restriction endonuclease McrA
MRIKNPRNTLPVEKDCKCCLKYLPASEFIVVHRKDGSPRLHSYCRTCYRNKIKATKEKNPERYRGIIRKWNLAHPEELREIQKASAGRAYQKMRQATIEAYGGKCVCCNESGIEFLTLDHVNNDGHEHRKKLIGTGSMSLYRWARDNGYPNSLQLLCYNCNIGKYKNGGTCPHEGQEIRRSSTRLQIVGS